MERNPEQIDAHKLLHPEELHAIQADLDRRCRPRKITRTHVQRVVFVLATHYGLRASELAGTWLGDVQVTGAAPRVRVRSAVAKYGQRRTVPMDISDWGRLILTDWLDVRRKMGAVAVDPLVVTMHGRWAGNPLSRHHVCRYFRGACAALPDDRQAEMHTHVGRHTFCSVGVELAGLASTKQWAGHQSIATTNVYTHALSGARERRNIFGRVAGDAQAPAAHGR